MTLLEKAKKMDAILCADGAAAADCPWQLGLESRAESEAFCRIEAGCAACYARPYTGHETPEFTRGTPPPLPIKDSGDRTQFPSGAVRDMHEGKGRFDLLPMCVLTRLAKHYEAGCQKYGDRNWETGIPCHSFADSAMRHLVKYMDGHTDEDHLVAAIWNLCGLAWNEEKRPDLMDIPARLIKED